MNIQRDLRAIVSTFVKHMGVSTAAIEVTVTPSANAIACALGLCLPKLGTLSTDMAIGRISLDPLLCNVLEEREVDYVLAHETVHIVKNHLLSSGMIRLLKQAVERDNPQLRALIDLGELLLAIGSTSIEGATTKEQEIEADVYAICLIGDKRPAISCLTKLVGGDLSRPSHLWEAFGVPLPVMTVGDRISQITDRITHLETLGWRFS